MSTLKTLIRTLWQQAPLEICRLVHSYVSIVPTVVAQYPIGNADDIASILCEETCCAWDGDMHVYGKHADEYHLIPGDKILMQRCPSNYIFSIDMVGGLLHLIGRGHTITCDTKHRNLVSCDAQVNDNVLSCYGHESNKPYPKHLRSVRLPDDYVEAYLHPDGYHIMDNHIAYIAPCIVDDELQKMVVVASV